jgi:hypothetical protein
MPAFHGGDDFGGIGDPLEGFGTGVVVIEEAKTPRLRLRLVLAPMCVVAPAAPLSADRRAAAPVSSRRLDALQRRFPRLPDRRGDQRGPTPFVAATFLAWTGGATWPISIYLIALAVLTLFAAIVAPETPRKHLRSS